MALNIGNLSFGVEADTKGLRKSIALIDKFAARTNRLASRQSKAAQTMAKARRVQIKTLKDAFAATVKLRQAQIAAKSPSEQIAKTSNAYRELTKALTQSRTNTVETTKALSAFQGKLFGAQAAVKKLSEAAKGNKLGGLTDNLRNLESASVLAVGPLSGIGARIRSLGAIAGRTNLAMVAMFAGMAAGVVVIGKLIKSSLEAGKIFESSMARFEAASGSIEIARREMAFVIKTSNELGLRISTSAKAFSRLAAAAKGSALEGAGVRKIYKGISIAAAALRLEQGEVEGAFRAIEQIMSKGSVQAEELRGQLGERLPGAFRIAAEAMGKTTQELGRMLKAGELLADDFLPKFIDAIVESFGKKALDNVNSFTGSMNLLANAGLLFSQNFNKTVGVSSTFIKVIHATTSAVRFLGNNLQNIVAAFGAVAAAVFALHLPAIGAAMIVIATGTFAWARALWQVNAALLANPGVALATVLAKVATVIVVGTAAFFGLKLMMDDVADSASDVQAELDALAAKDLLDTGTLTNAFRTVITNIESMGKEIDLLGNTLINLSALGPGPTGVEGRLRAMGVEMLLLGKNTKELAEISGAAGKILGLKFPADMLGASLAMQMLTEFVFDSQQAMARWIKTAPAMASALDTVVKMEERLEQLRKGQAAIDTFDDVTTVVRDFMSVFDDTNTLVEERTMIEARFRAALTSTIIETDKLTEAQRKQAEQERKDIAASKTQKRNEDRAVEALRRAVVSTKALRAQLKALSSGPDSLLIFEKITKPMDAWAEQMTRQGMIESDLNEQYKIRKQLLFEILAIQDNVTAAAQQSANAVVNSLEDIILKTKDVGDALRDLAKELLRIFLRATFLDPLLQQLTDAFSKGLRGANVGTQGGIPAPDGGGGGGSIAPRLSHGGSFTIPGSGGMDNKAVTILGKAGEEVTIRRPDQTAGMGSPTIVINAPGADAGTVERIREMIRVEMVPSIIQASTEHTLTRLKRPKFA